MTMAIPTKETLNCGDSLTVQRFSTSRCGAWQHADYVVLELRVLHPDPEEARS